MMSCPSFGHDKKYQVEPGKWKRGLGQRKDVLTTCKAVPLRGGQRIIAVFFPTVNILY